MLKGTNSDSNEQIIKTGSIELKLTENYETINKRISIMDDEEGLLQEETYNFNIKNIGDAPAKYDLKLINEVPNTYTGKVLDTKYIKIGLEINGTEYGPMSLEKVKNIIDSDIIYKKEVLNYKLRIWLDKSKEEEISKLEDYKAFLKLKIEATQRPESMDSGVDAKTFNYTGNVQEYTVPRDGYYYIEMAGAQGGTVPTDYPGGTGAKTSGYIYLKAGEKLYFYVGGKGTSGTPAVIATYQGGYNGGGNGYVSIASYMQTAASGGGATDVRLVGGTWNDTKSLISRIMVAGGGGGSYSEYVSSSEAALIYGGTGGTLYGNTPIYKSYSGYSSLNPTGGTQISGGKGLNAWTATSYVDSYTGTFGVGATGGNSYSGGGGGYYGGASGVWQPGAGGSSYISGYAGANSVKESTTITHTNQTIHYSGKYFIGAEMIEGQNKGNGYAKIKYIGDKPKRKNANLNNVRYIKDCISYNTRNNNNHWGEIQAIKDGINIAKGKTVIGSTTENSTMPYSRITDGDITYSVYAEPSSASSNQCVTVDLGGTYDLDEVALWNYFEDPRKYISNNFQVSSDNSNWTNLSKNEVWLESSNGARYNAYIDHINGYIGRTGLISWFDGYSNTGTTRTHNATTWKDLANTNTYKGTIKGSPVWYNNYLYFDGSDDWVQLSQMNYENPTIEVVYKKDNYTTGPEEGIVANFEGGGYGLTVSDSKLMSDFYISSAYRTIKKDFILNKIQSAATNYDGKNINLYTDGTLYDSYAISGSIGTPGNSTPMAIAANPSGTGIDSGRNFKGNIYSVRIYNKALTKEEIQHNYLYDKQRFNID